MTSVESETANWDNWGGGGGLEKSGQQRVGGRERLKSGGMSAMSQLGA